jgi:transglutaminase-like putative cysteine protease
MRMIATVAAIFIVAPVAAMAKDETVKIAAAPAWAHVSEPLPVPEDARGAVFLRRQNYQVHLEKSGDRIFSAALIRILDPNALQLGQITLSWNPAAGKPVVHAIKVHRAGAARDVLASTGFEIIRREDQLEAAILDGVLTAVLRVPDLRVGDELELSYSLPAHDPVLGSDSSGILFLTPVPPPGRIALRLSWDNGQEPTFRPTADLAGVVKKDGQAVSFSIDSPGPSNPPKDAPQRYNWQRVVEYSDFADWQSVANRIAPLFKKAASLPSNSAVKHEAAAIAGSHGDAMGRAAAALKLVQQQVRYVYVGFNGGNMTPVSAEETWQRRYGDCKGKTALLLALLGELGVPAQAVLVNNTGSDDGLDQRLPNPGFFDHVLVRAQIGQETYWLDPTLPPVIPPSRTATMPYRWVLPLIDSNAALERIAWRPEDKPDVLELVEIDARAGFLKPAIMRQISIKRGPAAIVEYYQFSSVTDDQLASGMRQRLEGSSSWNTIDKVTWRFDPVELASVLEITGSGPVEWEDGGAGSRSLTLPGGGFYPPGRRQRSADQDQTPPFYIKPEFDCRVTTVRLPTTTAQKEWSFNKAIDTIMFGQTFRRSFEKRDGSIRMIRSKRTLQTEIDPQTAKQDNERIAKFDNSTAFIYHDPGSIDGPDAAETVPATYEIDWVADPGACLAPRRKGK